MKRLRVIYFSDFDVDKNENFSQIMKKYSDYVVLANVSYLKKKNIIREYYNFVSECPSIIVGNSIGAYIGFYLSNITRTPSLLFNPSFNFKNGGELRSIEWNENFMEKIIVLSEKDEILDTKSNLKYLTSIGYGDKIRLENDLTHDIPEDVFEKYFEEIYSIYDNHIEKPSMKSRKIWAKQSSTLHL